jgi:hypothetical protein
MPFNLEMFMNGKKSRLENGYLDDYHKEDNSDIDDNYEDE